MIDKTKKELFIRRLAIFLTEGQAHKSILLEMGNPQAKEWAELRNLTPLSGYPTATEAEWILTEFLS